MKHTMNSFQSAIGVAFALALLTSIPLVAQTSFDLTNVEGENLAGVYTSPYYAEIDGSTTAVPVICDDFGDNSYIPEDWTTYVTQLSNVPASGDTTLKWNGANSGYTGSTLDMVDGYSWSFNQSQAYTVAAYLVLQIINANNSSAPAQQQEDLSFALWELFDANGATASPGGTLNWGKAGDQVVSWLGSGSSDLANATNDLESAITATASGTNASALNGNAVTIYSYDSTADVTGCGGCQPPPQEFITVTPSSNTENITPVPEPSSVAVLGVYFLFGGASLLLFGRRRIFRADS